MKKVLFLGIICTALLAACSQNSEEDEQYRKEIAELDSIQMEMENAVDELKGIEAELEEVDSLLNNI